MTIDTTLTAAMERLGQIFDELQGVAEGIALTLAARAASGTVEPLRFQLGDADRAQLRRQIADRLHHARWCDGAGYANYTPPGRSAAARTAADSEYWTLEWWASDKGVVRQVPLESDQGLRRRLDFRAFAWFREPAQAHRAYVDGPYVDYVCNESYTITAAHPVLAGEAFLGVGVADLLVSTLERELSPLLHDLAGPALVLNPDGRVVISTAPAIHPGVLWRDAEGWLTHDSAAHPFRLALRQP